MSALRAVVVDDEPLARETVCLLLDGVADIEVVGQASDGTQAVEAIERLQPDLVFLDVQMPHLDGFGVVEAVGPDAMPTTVFVTAFDDHALRAFDAAAVDYLVKPYDDARFHRALDRARAACTPRDLAERLHDLLRQRPATTERLLVRTGDRLVVVEARAIDWAEAAGDYVALHVGPKTHLIRDTLSGLAARLDDRFVRVHRSTVVQVDRVRDVTLTAAGDARLRLRDGTEIRASRRYWPDLEARLAG